MVGVFYVISYMNESSVLLFYYIYFILVYVIYQKNEFVLFLGNHFLFRKSGFCCENQPIIRPVSN